MSVDYDLVIIGNTPEALYAAQFACNCQARVALLLTSYPEPLNTDNLYLHLLGDQYLTLSTLSEMRQDLQTQTAEKIALLAAIGVDVILDPGEFVRLPSLALVTQKRRLRSRSYLLATGAQFNSCKPETPIVNFSAQDIENLEQLGNRLLILGESYQAVEIAQYFSHRHHQVTLVTATSQLFPSVDADVAQTWQAILEASGLLILTATQVSQIREIKGQKWVQAGEQALEVDDILLIPPLKPKIAGLNLTSLGITEDKISVNSRLQTTNRRIYACGEVLGAPMNIQVAKYQAEVAVKNALFLPRWSTNYENIPQVMFTNPPLARVGLTEKEAIGLYGAKIKVLNNYYHNNLLPHTSNKTSGLVKLVVKNTGEIVGGQIVGTGAAEMIGAIATAISSKTNISRMKFNFPAFTWAATIPVSQWPSPGETQHPAWLNWREIWFRWRRTLMS